MTAPLHAPAHVAALDQTAAVPRLRREYVRWFHDGAVQGRWPARAAGVADALRVLASDGSGTWHAMREPGIADAAAFPAGVLAQARAALGGEHLALLGPDRYGVAEIGSRDGVVSVTFGDAPARTMGAVRLTDEEGWSREDVCAQLAALVAPLRLRPTNTMTQPKGSGPWVARLVPEEGTDAE